MMRGDRLLKQVHFGKTDGKNIRGRPKRRWTDRLPGEWWTGTRKILAPCTKWWQTEPSVTNLCDMSWTPDNGQ